MDELFGLSMTYIAATMLIAFLAIMLVVGILAWRNRVMLRLGLRNIPRRKSQSVLIVVGSMLSAVIITAAFATGDTISSSIRSDAIVELGNIDEVITSSEDPQGFGQPGPPYFSQDEFLRLEEALRGYDQIDGMIPHMAETVPAFSKTTSLSEGRMRVTALDPSRMNGFAPLTTLDGDVVSVEGLPDGGLYLNESAAEELSAQAGHRITLHIGAEEAEFDVAGVVRPGGMAGESTSATALISLERGQELFDRPGQINIISVSNRGGSRDGANLSRDVTKRLRGLLADEEVAADLKELLATPELLAAIDELSAAPQGIAREQLGVLHRELQAPGVSQDLLDALSNPTVEGEVLSAIEGLPIPDERKWTMFGEAYDLFEDLAPLRVFEIKRSLLDIADVAGSGITSLFVMFGLFSIMVGILLIFLIFVMLAAARRTEMGMARAVGAKRSHLVQMFVFEGTAYDLMAAAVGTALGLVISYGIIGLLNYIIGRIDVDFSFTYSVQATSIIAAFCMGMIIVFATAVVSATRVSRMNIAEAVRGVPENIVLGGEPSLGERAKLLPISLGRPLVFLWQGLTSIARGRFLRGTMRSLASVLWVIVFPIWVVDLVVSVVRFSLPYLRRGWLVFLIGGALYLGGAYSWKSAAAFTLGMTLMIMGFGLMMRLIVAARPQFTEVFGLLLALSGVLLVPYGILNGQGIVITLGALLLIAGAAMVLPLVSGKVPRRPQTIDRHAFTLVGVLVLAFWLLPEDVGEHWVGELNADIEMFFISGICMVGAAVWTVMYNADLLLRGLTILTSRIGKLRPVVVTAVAYPMSAKFRTGLTLAMFSLVIFTMVVMSLLNDSFANTFRDTERISGGWDIEGRVTFTSPIDDISASIADNPSLSVNDFEAIGGYTFAPIAVRQVGAESQAWESYSLQASDDGYLASNEYGIRTAIPEYRGDDEAVWEALRRDPNLAVIDSGAVEQADQDFNDAGSFTLEGVSLTEDLESPITVEVSETLTGWEREYTIIAILDPAADPAGIIASRAGIDVPAAPDIPITTYRFMVAEGVDIRQVSKDLEVAFLANGMETVVLEDQIAEFVSFFRSFYNLLIGYMGLGLIVGIAALGVVSMRAVVERRQQIGVLRALGYRQQMVELSFLLESSFVTLLGVAIGVTLGFVLSNNLVTGFEDQLEGISFSVPWIQIVGIIIATYIFAMLTTYFPARQASRVTPADALRYE